MKVESVNESKNTIMVMLMTFVIAIENHRTAEHQMILMHLLLLTEAAMIMRKFILHGWLRSNKVSYWHHRVRKSNSNHHDSFLSFMEAARLIMPKQDPNQCKARNQIVAI